MTEEIDLRPWGYAPGFYLFNCVDCPASLPINEREMADKRAWRCKEHALAAKAESEKVTDAQHMGGVYKPGCPDCESYVNEDADAKRLTVETIVAAACKIPSMFYDGDIVLSVPRPGRHHHVLHPMHSHMSAGKYRIKPNDQGFLTSTGRWVSREEALQIAIAAKQPLIDHPSRHATQLFSEDLW